MSETDISTAAVERLLDGVTAGPWHVEDDWNVHCNDHSVMHGSINVISGAESEANANFTAASRDLVPALLADRDRLQRENDNLRQIERNVQAVREHERKRANAAEADRDRLAAEVARLREALGAWKTAFWTADQFAVAIHDADGKCYSVRAQDYHRMDELFHDRAARAARREGEA